VDVEPGRIDLKGAGRGGEALDHRNKLQGVGENAKGIVSPRRRKGTKFKIPFFLF
jgi:hypothetical protein